MIADTDLMISAVMTSAAMISAGALVMAIGLICEAIWGWPDRLYRAIGHPVSWLGRLITACDRVLNQQSWSDFIRKSAGIVTLILCVGVSIGLGCLVQWMLPDGPLGWIGAGIIASSLIAGKSLSDHVGAVATPLASGQLAEARDAVSMIVGRNPEHLDETGISRASIESLAENTSDGVVAPIFWGVLFGLPGLAGYKAVNTLDSMIGYRNDRYQHFGWASARCDDVLNLIPARLTGLIFCLMALVFSGRGGTSFQIMRQDASRHRSPNAGWPEAAMAGALDISLSGPRIYNDRTTDEPFIHENGSAPMAEDISRALVLYRRSMIALLLCLTGGAVPAIMTML